MSDLHADLTALADEMHAQGWNLGPKYAARIRQILAAPTGPSDQERHYVGLLLDAIRDIGVAAGVLREDIEALSGPEALMFAQDTAEHVRALREAQSAQEGPECACVGVTQRTDYGTGTEHDVDRSACLLHRGYEGPPPAPYDEPSQSEMALGHLFEISMRSWGVGRVVGDPTWSQADWTLPPEPVYVRAHSLQSALLQASDLPLHVWFETEESD